MTLDLNAYIQEQSLRLLDSLEVSPSIDHSRFFAASS